MSNAAEVTNQEFQKKGSEVHEDWKVKWEGAEMWVALEET